MAKKTGKAALKQLASMSNEDFQDLILFTLLEKDQKFQTEWRKIHEKAIERVVEEYGVDPKNILKIAECVLINYRLNSRFEKFLRSMKRSKKNGKKEARHLLKGISAEDIIKRAKSLCKK